MSREDSFLNPEITPELIKEIDKPIRNLIEELNKIEGVTTLGSCSGHFHDTEAYIFFKYTEHKNLDIILDFFRETGFTVKLDRTYSPIYRFSTYYIRVWSISTKLYSSEKDYITDENIEIFWNKIMNKFKEYKDETELKLFNQNLKN